MKLKKPVFKSDRNKVLAEIRKKRNAKKRGDGSLDFSDYSPLLQREERIQQVSDDCTLTKAVVNDLQTYIIRGLDLKEACLLSGIPYGRFQLWRTNYPEFNNFVKQCLALAKSDALQQIETARKGGVWQASSWFLERKWPAEFGKRDILKQELYYRYQEFTKLVLEVVNDADPELRAAVMDKLRDRKIDIWDQN